MTTHLDYNISVSLNSLNNVAGPIDNSPLPKLELDDAFNENESVLSLHEFKYSGSRRRHRSGSETTWEYKRQFLKIPYIDEISETEESNFHRSSMRSNITHKTSRHSVSILVQSSGNISCSNERTTTIDEEVAIEIDDKKTWKEIFKKSMYTLCCSWDCIPQYSKIQVSSFVYMITERKFLFNFIF